MRKVLLKIVLLVLIAFAVVCQAPFLGATETCNLEIVSGEKYTYEKFVIDGVVWVFVFDEQGAVVEIYPDLCGGPHFGGH